MSMNPEIKERWAAAIESGEYPNGQHYLLKDGCCCYLGVLCEIARKEGVVKAFDIQGIARYGIAEETDCLPIEVFKWAGWDSYKYMDPKVGDYTVTYHNDILETDPQEMARLIREHL